MTRLVGLTSTKRYPTLKVSNDWKVGSTINMKTPRAIHLGLKAQLSLVVVLVSLLSLGVLSFAAYFSDRGVVLDLRRRELTTISRVQAAQVSEILSTMAGECLSVAAAPYLQSLLVAFYSGAQESIKNSQDYYDFKMASESSDDISSAVLFAIDNSQVAKIWNENGGLKDIPSSLMPASNISMTNISHTAGNNNLAYVLGPELVNNEYYISFTRGITNNNPALGALLANSHVVDELVGYVTIILTTDLFEEALQNDGIDGFTNVMKLDSNQTYSRDDALNSSHPVYGSYVFALNCADYCQNGTFSLPQYAQDVLLFGRSGSIIDYKDDSRDARSIGFAPVGIFNINWAVVVTQLHDTVYQPLYALRNTLLVSVFSIGAGMCILTLILSTFAVRPVTRLQAATEQSTANMVHHQKREGLLKRGFGLVFGYLGFANNRQTSTNPSLDSLNQDGKVSELSESPVPNSTQASGLAGKLMPNWLRRRKQSSLAKKDDEFFTLPAQGGFRMPKEVATRKYIKDELVELTEKFNEMTVELRKQYRTLETRVVERTKEIEMAKYAAENANQAKSLFIANITHELRTPLNGILGMTAVSMDEDDPKQIKDSLGIIFKSGELLLHLLTDLLSFSKNQAHSMDIDEKEFVISEFVAQLKAIFGEQSKAANIHLSLDVLSVDIEKGVFLGDINRMLQIVINLISNSLKFTPEGGRVEVTIEEVENDEMKNKLLQAHAQKQEAIRHEMDTSITEHDEKDEGTLDVSSKSVSSHLTRRSRLSTAWLTGRRDDDSRNCKKDEVVKPQETPKSIHSSTFASPSTTRKRSSSTILGTNRSIDEDSSTADQSVIDDNDIIVVSFTVKDTGPGVAPHLQARIFEPFVQGDLALNERRSGAGLGLSICRQLANRMNGTVQLKSKLGEGSSFTFMVPLRKVKNASSQIFSSEWRNMMVSHSPATPNSEKERMLGLSSETESSKGTTPAPNSMQSYFPANPPAAGSSVSLPAEAAKRPALNRLPSQLSKEEDKKISFTANVLVAEDNKVNQVVMIRMLKLEGIENVSIANDGLEAVELVKKSIKEDKPFDIIFMDIQMPNLDGRQAAKIVKTELNYDGPVVAVSAFADASNIDDSLAAGMDHFLAKPLKRPHLHRLLLQLLETD